MRENMQISTAIDQRAASRAVEAELNFYDEMEGRPQIWVQHLERNLQKFDRRYVSINDGGGSPSMATLEREGFTLVPHASQVKDFEDHQQISDIYLPELRSLLLDKTGADRVEFPTSRGIVRHSPRSTVTEVTPPAHFPHVDASEQGLLDILSRTYPDRPKNIRRWATYNIWRALSPSPLDIPLALLDARTIRPQDLIPYDSKFDDVSLNFEALILRHHPAHRWTYFSQITPNDVLLFKTYDSDPNAPRSVAHTAFTDPSCPPDAPPRKSFEIRAYVSWSH